MKLWATVLAFHQRPRANSGIEGNQSNARPCVTAAAINRASHGECRRTPGLCRANLVGVAAGRGGNILAGANLHFSPPAAVLNSLSAGHVCHRLAQPEPTGARTSVRISK